MPYKDSRKKTAYNKKWAKENIEKVRGYWLKCSAKRRKLYPKKMKAQRRKSYLKYKDKYKEYAKKYRSTHKWIVTLEKIRFRVKDKDPKIRKYYYDKKVKNYLTKESIKYLWDRDKANRMRRPSIHRIDNDGDYSIKNCEYLEFSDHMKIHNYERRCSKWKQL